MDDIICYSLELVLAISLTSFGSNQTFFLPHRITEAASLFCSLSELQKEKKKYVKIPVIQSHIECMLAIWLRLCLCYGENFRIPPFRF